MVDWILNLDAPFGVVNAVGRMMGALDGLDVVEEEEGSFGGKYQAFHCNQWNSLRRGPSQITLEFLFSFALCSLSEIYGP